MLYKYARKLFLLHVEKANLFYQNTLAEYNQVKETSKEETGVAGDVQQNSKQMAQLSITGVITS